MWRLVRPDAEEVLKDEGARRALHRYFSILEGGALPKFRILKMIKVEGWDWEAHDDGMRKFAQIERDVDEGASYGIESPNLLDLKEELARRILRRCSFCERRCGVDRTREVGFCSCGDKAEISSCFVHLGEEPEIVPSFTVFFMGCTLQCIYCQNYTISQWMEVGTQIEERELAKLIENAWRDGCRNVNFVGGEPTPWTHFILGTMKECNANIPVVWNSNSIYSRETAKILQGFVDVYLLDFKYGPGECSSKLSKFPRYWEVCTRNHKLAAESGELVIRHLVLPGHLECCTRPILEWISRELGENTRVNIMFQYRPEYDAYKYEGMNRRLTDEEMRMAVEIAEECGLRNYIT